MNKSNTICRDVLDTKDVIVTQLSNLLATELVGTEKLSASECKDLSNKLVGCVSQQTDMLVDRILNEFK